MAKSNECNQRLKAGMSRDKAKPVLTSSATGLGKDGFCSHQRWLGEVLSAGHQPRRSLVIGEAFGGAKRGFWVVRSDLCPKFPPAWRGVLGVKSLALREEISRGLAANRSLRAIARDLSRSPSTVSREVRRNGGRQRRIETVRLTTAIHQRSDLGLTRFARSYARQDNQSSGDNQQG